MRLEPIRAYCDDVMSNVFIKKRTAAEKQQAIMDSSWRLGSFILSLDKEPNNQAAALKGSTLLATIPSLLAISSGQPHNHGIAIDVSNEFTSIAEYIKKNKISGEENDKIRGQLSETAIMGLLWWGVANGYDSPQSWARTSTTKEDMGTYDGLRNGVDIVYHDKTQGKRQLVQVKSSRGYSSNGYAPNIKVVAATTVAATRNPHVAHKLIFNGLLNGNCETMWQIAMESINEAHPRLAQSTYKTTTRTSHICRSQS